MMPHLGPPGWAIGTRQRFPQEAAERAGGRRSAAAEAARGQGAVRVAPEQAVGDRHRLHWLGQRSEPTHGGSRESGREERPELVDEAPVPPRSAHDVEPANPPGLGAARLRLQPRRQQADLRVKAAQARPDVVEPVPDLDNDRLPGPPSERALGRSTATAPRLGRRRAPGELTSPRSVRSRRSRSGGAGARCRAADRRLGACSKNATSCSPTAAERHAHVSIEAVAPCPRSSQLTRPCETPAASPTSACVRSTLRRASRSATPRRLAMASARRRPARVSGLERRRCSLRLPISAAFLRGALHADVSSPHRPQ